MSEKETRISLAGAALLGSLLAACEDSSAANESLIPESTATVRPAIPIVFPTVTLAPTETPFVTPTLTPPPESSQVPDVPQFEGLSLVKEGEKWVYQNERGEYAGEIIDYIFNGEKTQGVLLTPASWRTIEPKFNTPEKIAAGEWVIPFPLDPRGEKELIISRWRPGILDYVFLTVSRVGMKAKIVSPFKESVKKSCSGVSPGFGGGCDLTVPSKYCMGSDHALIFIAPERGYSETGRNSATFGEKVIGNISGSLGPKAPRGTQLIVALGPGAEYDQGEDMNISDNILAVKSSDGREMTVFLAAAS